MATRPLGASLADWLGKPQSAHGLGLGAGPVALALTAAISCVVAYLAITRRDVQSADAANIAPATVAQVNVREDIGWPAPTALA